MSHFIDGVAHPDGLKRIKSDLVRNLVNQNSSTYRGGSSLHVKDKQGGRRRDLRGWYEGLLGSHWGRMRRMDFFFQLIRS